jgi:polyphosphate kinase
MDAVKRGKHVSVFVEIKARFDEATNLEWGEKMEKAGVRGTLLVPRREGTLQTCTCQAYGARSRAHDAYLGTGNFHEETAKVYSDLAIFTADKRLTAEVSHVFSFLENVKPPAHPFQHLMVGKFNLRSGLDELIDREIEAAKAGREAGLIIKLNSLEDREVIAKLYEASQAGVKVKLMTFVVSAVWYPDYPVSATILKLSVLLTGFWSMQGYSFSQRRQGTHVSEQRRLDGAESEFPD